MRLMNSVLSLSFSKESIVKLSNLKKDSLFVLDVKKSPLFHKGNDGIIRKVCGGWYGLSTMPLTKEESREMEESVRVVEVFITLPLQQYDT